MFFVQNVGVCSYWDREKGTLKHHDYGSIGQTLLPWYGDDEKNLVSELPVNPKSRQGLSVILPRTLLALRVQLHARTSPRPVNA